jgi:hypothetical protein
MKKCAKCKVTKPFSEFYKHKSTKDKLHCWCKDCTKLYATNRKKEKAERVKSVERNRRLKEQYGITLKDYNEMLAQQNDCCGICGKHKSESKCCLAVDHDHATGHVRGLLCSNCNLGIGYLKDDLDILRNAVNYLTE